MSEKKTRGRRSKIDLLPEDIKAALNEMLRDGRLEQQEILAIVNQKIDDAGLPEDKKLSKSGINRYASRMEAIGAKIRQSREVADAWTAKFGSQPTSDVSKLLLEIIRTLTFETSMAMTEGGDPVPPKILGQLALAAQRTEAAAMAGHKREKEIRQAFAEEAATELDSMAQEAGWSAESIKRAKNKFLGIA